MEGHMRLGGAVSCSSMAADGPPSDTVMADCLNYEKIKGYFEILLFGSVGYNVLSILN